MVAEEACPGAASPVIVRHRPARRSRVQALLRFAICLHVVEAVHFRNIVEAKVLMAKASISPIRHDW
jgi:hypothetical protein